MDNKLIEYIEHMKKYMSMQDVRRFRKTNKDGFRKRMETRYEQLYKMSPTLFDLVLSDDCDMDKLKWMLNMQEQIKLGKLDNNDASKIVGQKLFDEYVQPIVDNTPPDRKPE